MVLASVGCAPGAWRPLDVRPPLAEPLSAPVGVDPDALVYVHNDLYGVAQIPELDLEEMEDDLISLVESMFRGPPAGRRAPVDVIVDLHERANVLPAETAGAAASVFLGLLGLPIILALDTRSYEVWLDAEVSVTDPTWPRFVCSIEVPARMETYDLITDAALVRQRLLGRALKDLHQRLGREAGPRLLEYLGKVD